MTDEEPTARSPSSLRALSQWGLVRTWLVEKRGRGVVLNADERGLIVMIIDGSVGEVAERVEAGEDVVRVTLRGISRLSNPLA